MVSAHATSQEVWCLANILAGCILSHYGFATSSWITDIMLRDCSCCVAAVVRLILPHASLFKVVVDHALVRKYYP